jgi:hypothetical protein
MKRNILYTKYIAIFIISLIALRQMSFVNEQEAKDIALDIMHQKYSRYCGNNFTENIVLNTTNPLGVSGVFGIDKSGYTFVANS